MADLANVVYSYGGGEALFKVLVGVQMIFAHEATKSLLYMMTLVGLVWAGFQGAQQNSWTPKLSWLIKYVLITSLFITPTATLWVTDVVYNKRDKIEGLPIGLVLPASIFSGIGYGVTQLFDQAFSKVDDNLGYSKYGQSFGAALISQARNFKIQDAGFRENIESFIDNCMLYDVMVGRKYNADDLRNSTRIWELASTNASNIRMMNYRDADKTVKRKLVTCKEGISLMSNYWTTDIDKLAVKFGSTIFGKYASNGTQGIGYDNGGFIGQAFKANFGAVSQLYGKNNGAATATETLKQIMMINALADIPMSYGAVRAKQQQQESWLISGQLAREILPTLHAIFAALIYASFTLIIGMLVLPNGFKTLANYLGLLIWIETWPPLFAVLNLLSNISSKTYGGDFNTITMNNISQIVSHNNNISVVASGMMMVLPYLSYNILKGGAGQFVHLASQVMGASQSSAMAASSEVTSGNRSLDNVSMLNSQWSNHSGFKTDMNTSYRAGHREYQMESGMIVKESPSGKLITQAGPGLTETVGSQSMHTAIGNSTQTHQSFGDEQSQMVQNQKEYDKTEQFMDRQLIEYSKRIAAGEASGEHYNHDYATADGKVLHESIAKSKGLSDTHSYNHNQASEMTVKGNVGGGLTKSFGGGGSNSNNIEQAPQGLWDKVTGGITASVNVGLDLSASGRAESINSQGLTEDKGASTNTSVTDQNEAMARAIKNTQYSDTQTEEKTLADSISGSYEKMQNLRTSIHVSQQHLQKYQTNSDSSQSHSSTVSENDLPKIIDFIAGQRDKTGFKIGQIGAAKMAEARSEEFNKYTQDFYKTAPSHQQVQKPNLNYEQFEKENMQQNIDLQKNYNDVSENINSAMQTEKAITRDAKNKVEQQHQVVPDKIEVEEQKLLKNGEQLQKDVNQKEQDRLKVFGRSKDKNNNFREE